MAKLDLDDWNALDKRKFLLYGGAFTVAVDFLIYPLELVKTRVQVEAKVREREGYTHTSACVPPSPRRD